MKRLVLTGMALCAATSLAMPTKTELSKAQPLVNELMKSVVDDFRDKNKTAKEVAEAAEQFAGEAEGEAAKFLLLKGAVNYYSRAKEYDKAADTVEKLQSEISEIPPDVLAEIISRATCRINKKNAPRLLAQYKTARAQMKAEKEQKTLEAALKKRPGNLLARREYAELLAVSGEWKAALDEFKKLKDKTAQMAKAESIGKAKAAEVADFWWNYKAQSEEAEDAIKAHAAFFYKKAIDAKELSGLKKTLAEQRIEEVGSDALAAAEKACRVVCKVKIGGSSPFYEKDSLVNLKLKDGVVMSFVNCPPGRFKMGYASQDTRFESARVHDVVITRPFLIGQCRVTRGQLLVMGIDKGRIELEFPVEPIEPNLIAEYCRRLTEKYGKYLPEGYVFRLPTNAEREYAVTYGEPDVQKLKRLTQIDRKRDETSSKISAMTLDKKTPVNKIGLYGTGDLYEYVLDSVDMSEACRDGKELPPRFNVFDAKTKNTFRYEAEEIDPVRLADGKNARVLACVGAGSAGWFIAKDFGGHITAFRVVIGPDVKSLNVYPKKK